MTWAGCVLPLHKVGNLQVNVQRCSPSMLIIEKSGVAAANSHLLYKIIPPKSSASALHFVVDLFASFMTSR